MVRFLLWFFILGCLCSCSDSTPKGIISKETMVPLLTDLHVANGYSTTLYGYDNTLKTSTTYNALYNKYSTDSAGLRKSLEYYTQRPEEFSLIYQEVEKRMNQLQKDEQARYQRQQKLELNIRMKETAKERRRLKFIQFRNDFAKGKYDFGASTYKTPAEAYLKPWKAPAAKAVKIDSVKTDSVKNNLLLKRKRRR